MSSDDNFHFIPQNPNGALSKETRTIIRKQAMRGVAAARRKNATSISQSSSGMVTHSWYFLPKPTAPMPTSGLELLVKDKGLDPMDLSALTSIHIGEV
jgi:hypothetical protein